MIPEHLKKLERYLAHNPGCPERAKQKGDFVMEAIWPCSCGLNNALADIVNDIESAMKAQERNA